MDFYQLHLMFQNFMIEKGYSVRNREKLISTLFPTTFTMSGGPDLAYKFWQGDKSVVGNHIVNQPCVRHWDIEATGDEKHLSFFNMFVADSVGGYSRKEVLAHFIEFFVKYLGLDPTRFYASYFSGGVIHNTRFEADNELKDIWLSLGIKESNILEFGDADGMEAFVANTIEPVGGPRGELFYDLRDNSEQITSLEEFFALDKQGLLLEFCTHVLYNLRVSPKPNYSFEPLTKEAVAVGFGPQRVLTILEHVTKVGDISVFDSLKQCIGTSENSKASVITLDHIRGLVFLINDGALELQGRKNNSRKYLFRKYMKNFKANFSQLPLEQREVVLRRLIFEAIKMFSVLFPEFAQRKEYILNKFLDAYGRY